MPKVTVWIKKADQAKWDAIKDRPAWLHEKLNPLVNAVPPEYRDDLLEPLKDIVQSSVREKMDSMQVEDIPPSWRQATFEMGKPFFKKGKQ